MDEIHSMCLVRSAFESFLYLLKIVEHMLINSLGVSAK